jgi:hypothetical protein
MTSNQTKKLILIPLLLLSALSFATKYYVRNGGNDANSGLNDADAWAHHPWMSTWTGKKSLVPGDIVYMKRGSKWTIDNPQKPFLDVLQSGTPGSFIITTAYGSGEKPLIKINTATDEPVVYLSSKAYILFDNLHIQHHSGAYVSNSARSGFHMTNVCHHIEFTNNEIDHCPYTGIVTIGDSHHIVVGDTMAVSTATVSSFSNHIHDFGYAGVGLQGTDPSSKASHFYIYNNYIHDATRLGSGNNAYGIYFSASVNSSSWPRYAVARFNRIENVKTWEAIDIHGGEYVNISDNYIRNFGTCGVHIAVVQLGNLAPLLSHIYIDRNCIEQPQSGWIEGHENSFIVHFNSLDNFISADINIRQNKCYYAERPVEGKFDGIRFGNINGLTVTGNQIYNGAISAGKSGINISDNYGTYGIRNALIKGNYIDRWGPGIGINGSCLTGEIKIVYNIITNSESNACIKISNEDIPSAGSVLLSNNVLIQGSFARCFQAFGGIKSGGTFEAKNNIMGWFEPKDGYYWQWLKTIEGTFNCDHNIYWNGTDALSNFIYQNFNNEEWINAGYDIHSLFNTDPQFENFSGNFSNDLDFYISAASPVIDAGSAVSYSEDYVGAKTTGLPDIGAFERQENNDFPVPLFSESYINDSFPAKVRVIFDASLSAVVPPVSFFSVSINGKHRIINTIEIENRSVFLVLSSRAYFGDVIHVSYLKPVANPLSNSYGGNAPGFSEKDVINNLTKINIPPVVVINADSIWYSGIAGELDASESYDEDHDSLSFSWECNTAIPMTAINESKLQFLDPMSLDSRELEFTLTINDGKNNQSQTINVTSIPFKPELKKAVFASVNASDFVTPNIPENINDGDPGSYWAMKGNNQWLTIKLKEPYMLEYLVLAFNKDFKRPSYFDLFASIDSINWVTVLNSVTSYSFSSDRQIFEVPAEKRERHFTFFKFVGHGNSVDDWNYISEFLIFGIPFIYQTASSPSFIFNHYYHNNNLFVFSDNISPDLQLNIISILGNQVYNDKIEENAEIYPINLIPGIYILEIRNHITPVYISKFVVQGRLP